MSVNAVEPFDVVVVGGGPAGSTCASLLRKHHPNLTVAVIERAVFPRDHVGESQLPGCAQICAEMGCWEKVEAAGFPVKLGASYVWGRDAEAWEFNFVFPDLYTDDLVRPATFEGVRRHTAFHVDRAIYDTILLDHTQELGATVRQGVAVREVLRDGDRVNALLLDDGSKVKAKWFVDASGAAGVIRKAMDVRTHAPEALRNVAVWGYWTGAEWASRTGHDGTRILIHSLPYGWLWYIPIGRDRISVGLVVHADYYKRTGKPKEELYRESIARHQSIGSLLASATLEKNTVHATSDWSYTCDRLAGENWFLIGEAAGFADPILSAGMLIAHRSGQDCAATVAELTIGELDPDWLRRSFDAKHRKNILQYIRFAQFWYASNGCFTDLMDECAAIAREGGISLSPEQAWQWLSSGGFAIEDPFQPSVGSFDVFSAKDIAYAFLGERTIDCFERYNTFTLDTNGAHEDQIGSVKKGRIAPVPCLRRDGATLPLVGYFGTMHKLLSMTDDAVIIINSLMRNFANLPPHQENLYFQKYMATLEAMIQDGWVKPSANPQKPFVKRPRTARDPGRYVVDQAP